MFYVLLLNQQSVELTVGGTNWRRQHESQAASCQILFIWTS